MKKIFKLLFLAISLLSFMLVFVGCGNDDTSEPHKGKKDIYELNSYRVELNVDDTFDITVLNEGNFSVVWKSKNDDIATVSDSGRITAVSAGKTEISVNIEQEEEIIVTVLVADNHGLIPMANFTINSEISKIYVDYTKTLTPKLVIGSEVKDVKEYGIAYSSSNNSVVEVDADGVITGKSVGEAVISARVEIGEKEYVATTDVKVISLCYVQTDSSEIILSRVGNESKTKTIVPELYRVEGNTAVKVDYTGEWIFTSSDNSIATVNGNGVITSVNNGSAIINVKCKTEGAETNVNVNVFETYAVIRTPYDFINIKNGMDGYYELANDIDFEGIAFTPFCLNSSDPATSTAFTGCLNGNGYAVKNIKHEATNHLKSIFPVLGESGVIKDIAFIDVLIPASRVARSAGLVWSNFGTIENVFISLTTNGTGSSVNEWGFGGIVSANRGTGVVTNCIVDLTDNSVAETGYDSATNTGAIFNVNQGGEISDNIAIINKQNIKVYTHTGSFGTIANNIIADDVNEVNTLVRSLGFDLTLWKINTASMPSLINKGEDVEYYEHTVAKGSNGDMVIGTNVTALYGYNDNAEKTPIPYATYTSGVNVGKQYVSGSAISLLPAGVNTFYMEQADGTFTQINLLVITAYITNAADFAAIANDSTGYYILANDISLGEISVQNTGYIASFGGTLDGNGHKITYSYANLHYVRLIQTIENGAIIKNVWFNLTGTGSDNRAGQYGLAMYNYGTVENCFMDVTFLNVGQAAGTNLKSGMIQSNKGTIRNNIIRVNYTGTTAIVKGTAGIIGITSGGEGTVANNMLIGLVPNATGTIDPFHFAVISTNTSTQTSESAAVDAFDEFVSDGFNTGTIWTKDASGIYFNGTKIIG